MANEDLWSEGWDSIHVIKWCLQETSNPHRPAPGRYSIEMFMPSGPMCSRSVVY